MTVRYLVASNSKIGDIFIPCRQLFSDCFKWKHPSVDVQFVIRMTMDDQPIPELVEWSIYRSPCYPLKIHDFQ